MPKTIRRVRRILPSPIPWRGGRPLVKAPGLQMPGMRVPGMRVPGMRVPSEAMRVGWRSAVR